MPAVRPRGRGDFDLGSVKETLVAVKGQVPPTDLSRLDLTRTNIARRIA
jgi:hypothetical protein